MISNGLYSRTSAVIFTALFFLCAPPFIPADDHKRPCSCLDKAVSRILEIRSLPEIKYLHTLDDQQVLLAEFYAKSHSVFPQCCLFRKFYYWQSEIREVFSNTRTGPIKHKIRCYYNCLSTYCPDRCDPRKSHGDVAEFYDPEGNFMGLAVYIGEGKYCALPYDGYKK